MTRSLSQPNSRAVANWILLGVFLLFVQVMLGGITRLTGSGLSITEWDLVTGAFPPLNQQQWTAAFDKYKQTRQFQLLHADFTLSDFKFIFFWEWVHRLWARLIGVIFLLGFGWLLWKKKIKKEMVKPLLILFLLGGLQGAVGWLMVVSGLTGDAIYVLPTRLALHFVFALGLICYTCWFALFLLIPKRQIVNNNPLRSWTVAIIFLLFFQLLFGALMAGHKAAAAAPSWPTINGYWLPSSLFTLSPLPINFIENKITIHFIHRGLAYLLFIAVLVWTLKAVRPASRSDYLHKTRGLPLMMLLVQIILGIIAVLSSPGIIANSWGLFDWIALLHQTTGMLFLLTMVYMLYLVKPEKRGEK
jgi:cytochrome c oxidase assembly protein subunit 15